MKPIKKSTQYYVYLLTKLGLFRFSILFALVLVAFSVLIQVGVTITLEGGIYDIDIVRFVSVGLLITPWAVYFLSVIVDELEKSRQRLSKLVSKLKEMRSKDRELNSQLHDNIVKLNEEIKERKKAEEARKAAMEELKSEVTQREKTQLELIERTALLRSFLDVSPDLIYYRSLDGLFSGCNRAVEELTGRTEKELVGLTPWDIYSQEVAKKVVETDEFVFNNRKEITYDLWLEYPDGKKTYVEIRKVPFFSTDDGRYLGLVGFGREITERKKYQDALEKASQDKTTFISTLSHELRTPLNGIVGLSRILLDTSLTTEQRQHMQTINVSAITLDRIFNDIIDLDKLDRRKLELLPQSINLEDFVSEVGSITALMAEQRGLRFDLERLTDLPRYIQVDATRLRQVLWNLIANATKFTQEGGVIMNVSAEVKDEGIAQIIFEIEDTGIGISSAEIDKIFAMYYQVKSKKNNLHAVGTGIGLAVSKQLVTMMGGSIKVVSEEGFGSTFTVNITVPIVNPLIDTKHQSRKQEALRIFMVEDIELNITVAKSLLESLGHSVSVAMSGEEAITRFTPEAYDLVLLDIQLPDMNGFDVAKYYREQFRLLPPLVALTANIVKNKKSYTENGMDDALSKPFSVKGIQRVIDKWCFKGRDSDEDNRVPDKTQVSDFHMISNVLDREMLESYVNIVGVESMLDNIKMFEDTMPNYIEVLESNMIAKDQDGVVSEAHKIKSAAGSIGLMHIQKIAQKIQSPQMTAWWENVADWVEEIKSEYKNDIVSLKEWLREISEKKKT